ncbi:MAG: peptidase [Firmicutes bacterium]|nr:peptidase [Bacillota bacterium]
MAKLLQEYQIGHTFGIATAEYHERRARIIAQLEKNGQKGIVFFRALSIFWLSGFGFIPTERPVAFVLKTDGSTALLVPRLEVEHGQSHAYVDRIESYPEYPTTTHPMLYLQKLLGEMGLANSGLAADGDGYGAYWGYRGPKLSEVCAEATVSLYPRLIEEMRFTKSRAEIELIKESCKWGNLAHMLLQKYSRDGASEIDVSTRASSEATNAMLLTLGPTFKPGGMGRVGASAGFRGQIGKNSYFPHAVTLNATMRKGDVLVTGAGANVCGYVSELERTMFVGEPSAEQTKYFELMCQAQEVAFDTIKPGVPTATVDREVRRFFEENQLMPYWRHHVGHAIGMEGHEAPFFDIGDETILEPGMVWTVEPGIYVEGLGGFRHSDTVLITENGMEFLTYYPRHLEAMICG